MTIINLNFSSSSNLAVPAGWNKTGTNPLTSAGVIIADMIDNAGDLTGIGFEITSPFVGRGASASWATEDHWGIPMNVWREAATIRNSTINGQARLFGFNAGQTGVITTAGHINSATLDTDYVVNGGAPVRYDATVTPPAEPINIPFTADSNGDVFLSTILLSTSTRSNFLIVEYTESTAPTITDIDQLIEGETSTITFSAPFAVTSLLISDGVASVSVTALSGSGSSYTFTCPALTVGQVRPKVGAVSVTASDGTETTSGFVAEYEKSGYSSVILDDVSADNYRQGTEPQLETGSQVIFPVEITVDDSGIHSGDIAGEYVIYDISPIDHVVRSFTLNYGGEPPEPVPSLGKSHYLGFGIGIGFN